jgi:hypothetical protein
MPRANVFIFIIILCISLFVSGCYTMFGYPPELEERYVGDEGLVDSVYGYREYYPDYSSLDYSYYYDPYYGFIFPYSDYYYGDSSWWWRDYDNYNYRNYDQYYYAPKHKPETKYRLDQTRSAPSTKRESRSKDDEEKENPKREIRSSR